MNRYYKVNYKEFVRKSKLAIVRDDDYELLYLYKFFMGVYKEGIVNYKVYGGLYNTYNFFIPKRNINVFMFSISPFGKMILEIKIHKDLIQYIDGNEHYVNILLKEFVKEYYNLEIGDFYEK